MAQNIEKESSSIYESLQYAFDKVVFNQGNPPLSNELNVLQEYLELITQKSTAGMPSGWLSYRPFYTSTDLSNSFYTQAPTETEPEIALVNGWPIYVTNTNTSLQNVNEINLNDAELKSGSRVDGVFLEVWRSLITPNNSTDLSKPQSSSSIGTINGILMFNEDLGWAVGEKGIILKTVDGGITWTSKETPIPVNFNKIKFYDQSLGYAVAEKGYIIKTVDGGESWFTVSSVVNDNLNDLFILDQNTVVVVGDNGTILKTLDGTLFEIIENTSGITNNLNGVYFYDNRIGWTVGDSSTMLITVDEGQSWKPQTVLDVRTNAIVNDDLVSVAFFSLDDGLIAGKNGSILKTADGGYHFVNLSDRIWNGTSYQTIGQVRPYDDNTFNRLYIRNSFPYQLTISVYGPSVGLFKNLSYQISPQNYPNSLVLMFRGTLDGKDYIHVLDLNSYATAEDLTNDVNNLMSPYSPDDVALPDDQRKKVRVFMAMVNYTSAPSDFRPSSGTIQTTGNTNITFSLEDKAWIVGNDGLVLMTSNSGSKWEVVSNNYGFDLYDMTFIKDNLGWIVGSEGSILIYDPVDYPAGFMLQDTDLPLRTKGRIYPEGNILSQAEDFLDDTIIDPNVGVETSDRVQIQYRIRIVTGVDPFDFQEAGLGADYVYSLGPNNTSMDSGYYSFENMGSQNGDYGLWRARCRNTYDGWTWAVPMFFVTRRNSSPFNPDTNINGSTIYEQNAIRPDGLTYEDIMDTDITDLRKKINIQSYTALFEKNFDKLLGNRLTTKLSQRDEKGTQYGTSIMLADTYVGTELLNNLVTGLITSEAKLVYDVKILDPNGVTPLTDNDWTIGPTLYSIYMTDPSYHEVKSYLNGIETSKIIPGYFEGLGTNKIKFDIGNYTPTTGEQYLIRVGRIDYSNEGLSKIPNQPLGIKYLSDTEDNSVFYRGINTNDTSDIIEYTETRVPGYQDYTILYPGVEIGATADDINLYSNTDIYDESTSLYQSTLLAYNGQQFRGSLIEYHYFIQATDFISQLTIPKILNNYSILNVKKIVNAVSGVEYLVAADYSKFNTVWSEKQNPDLTFDNTMITIFLDPSYTIPKDAIIEVTLEVAPTDTTANAAIALGLTTSNTGPNIQAYRAPFTVNYNVGSKGIEGLYRASLFNTTVIDAQKVITIDLTVLPAPNDLRNGLILGLSSYHTRTVNYQCYVWYQPTGQSYFETIPVSYVENLGTSSVNIWLDSAVTLSAGSVYIPMLVKQTEFASASDTSEAYVFYKYRPYQTVDSLPNTLTVEILTSSDFIYVSNLGTGGSNKIKKEPYENPIEHIPVNDTAFVTDNLFTNIDELNFTNFSVDTGFVKMPAYISRKLGEDIIFSQPNNIGDRLGRTFYTNCSENFRFQTDALVDAIPRKVFLPMIGRIKSDVTQPFVRGEIVLIIFSKAFEARSENEIGFFVDDGVEYSPGYFEEADTAIAIYRMTNFPTARM